MVLTKCGPHVDEVIQVSMVARKMLISRKLLDPVQSYTRLYNSNMMPTLSFKEWKEKATNVNRPGSKFPAG